MFEKVIKHLRSQVRNNKTISADTTGVLVQSSKDEAIVLVAEFENAINILEGAASMRYICLNEGCCWNLRGMCGLVKVCPGRNK